MQNNPAYKEFTLSLLVGLLLSTDNLCKQFGRRSGPKEQQSLSGSKLFDRLIVFLKDFLVKVSIEIVSLCLHVCF